MNIEDLKCCGNCGFYTSSFCSFNKNKKVGYAHCKEWYFDGVPLDERKEYFNEEV